MLVSRRAAAAAHASHRRRHAHVYAAATCCCSSSTTTTTTTTSSSSSSSTHRVAMAAAAALPGAPAAVGRTVHTSSPVAARAFVGTASPLAAEYHSSDYDWQQHAAEVAPALDAQWDAAPAAVRDAAQLDGNGNPLPAVAALLASLKTAGGAAGQSDDSVVAPRATASEHHTQPAAVASNSSHTSEEQQPTHHHQPQQPQQQQQPQQPTNEWEAFYRAHPAARFFKERRYLLLEFPCLAPPARLDHVVEIGAGCGSSILPVLRAQPGARATLCDVSATCLAQLRAAAGHAGLDASRLESFVADGASVELGQRLSGAAADAALIMFTLSAVPPDGMLLMMANAAAALRPGGLLCIRDHALGDMVQLRIAPEQCIARHLYRRGDGTLAYFYTTQELAGLARAVGLEVVEADYVTVVNTNRKTGQQLRRAFVHGLFRKTA